MNTITKTQLVNGLVRFVEENMLPSLGGWQIIAAAVMVNLAKGSANTMVDQLLASPMAKSLGIVGEDGTSIDIGKVHKAFTDSKDVAKPFPLDLGPFGIFTVSPNDIEKLFTMLEGSKESTSLTEAALGGLLK